MIPNFSVVIYINFYYQGVGLKTKAAVQFTLNGPLELVDLELPDPRENQVIVKMYSSGVCHSQLHQMANPNLPRPLVLGHEGTGIVTKTGKNVSHVSEGDHVIVTWVKRVETQGSIPAELTGVSYHETLVHGNVYTLGEDVLTNSDYVVPIDKEYPTDISCIVGCAVLTGAGAVINTAQVKPGESVAVFGAGGVGLCAIQAASINKANPVIAVDLDNEKLKFAQEFGATHLINASEKDPIEQIKDITNGGVDYAFDAIGVKITNEQILESTRSGGSGANNLGGTSILIGLPHGNHTMSIPPRLFVGGQRTYKGSLGATYPDTDFPMFLDWYKNGEFPLDKLITKRYKFDDINEAYESLSNGEILGRSIVIY
tara:strand:+ start:169 stop:1281 length:1113 start_codon:yes stop_codon:yes gene_type:complete